MLEYDRINVSGEVNVNRTNVLHEHIICHNWYFFKINFRFQPEVYNGYHDLMQITMSVIDFAIVSFNGNDWYVSKYKAINLLKSTNLTEKSGIL